jgi:hypothetical protein
LRIDDTELFYLETWKNQKETGQGDPVLIPVSTHSLKLKRHRGIESYLPVYLATMLYLATMDSILKWNHLMASLKTMGKRSWLRYQLNYQRKNVHAPGNVTKGFDCEGMFPAFKPLFIEGRRFLDLNCEMI